MRHQESPKGSNGETPGITDGSSGETPGITDRFTRWDTRNHRKIQIAGTFTQSHTTVFVGQWMAWDSLPPCSRGETPGIATGSYGETPGITDRFGWWDTRNHQWVHRVRHQESPKGSSGETPGITERFRNPYIEIKKFNISTDGTHTRTVQQWYIHFS